MMRVLESWEYGDPERVAIRREEEAQRKDRACGACVHKISARMFGETLYACEYLRREYGRQCELYEVRRS